MIGENTENLLEITSKEANNVIDFFSCNNLVNNSEKAAILYNTKGRGGKITIHGIGGETLESVQSEKLLGLHINSDFEWSNHIDKVCIELKKRIGILNRIKNRVPREKLIMISEAIFNSLIRYGVSVYLNPVFDEEDLKLKRMSKNMVVLQTLQNRMLRSVLGLKKEDHVNMINTRRKLNMMSVNQICIYHTLLETYNILRNLASEEINSKWKDTNDKKYSLRSISKNVLKVPEKPVPKCLGFTYNAAKLFNMLPIDVREITNENAFKIQTKDWIWKNIPSQ